MSNSRIPLVFILFLLILPAALSAQAIKSKPSGMKVEPVKKQVFDTAKFRVYYDYSARRDPDNPLSKKKALLLVQVGKRYNCMKDYASVLGDSINDASLKSGKSGSDVFFESLSAYSRRGYYGSVLYDRNGSTMEYREDVGGTDYVYSEPVPDIEWQLVEGDSTIAGYNCKKATAHFRGRDYVAWYSPAIALPYGPYKFQGLPGLIFCIYDTRGHYAFTLSGLVQVQSGDLIYLSPDRGKEVSREDFLRIVRNYCADPSAAYSASGKNVYDANGKPLKLPSQPFNPIELN